MTVDVGGESSIWTSHKLIVIFTAFVMNFVFSGVLYSFSEYFGLLVEKYNVSYSLIGSVGTAVSGFSNFVSPVSGWLVLKLSYKVVIPCAGALISLSFILTSYAQYGWELYFTYSILFGVGGGILNNLALSLLVDAMTSKEETAYAMSISNIGAGTGIVAVSCFAAYFTNVEHILSLDELFRYMALLGAFVVVEVLAAFVIIGDNITMKAFDKKVGHDGTEDTADEYAPSIEEQSNPDESISLLRGDIRHSKNGWDLLFSQEGVESKAVQLFVSQIFGIMMTIIPYKFGILFATSQLTDVNVYYYVPLVMGIGNVLSRFFFTRLVSHGITSFEANKILQLGGVGTSLMLTFVSADSMAGVLIGLFLYSLFTAHYPLAALRTVELLGSNGHHANFGVQCFAIGIGYIIGGYTGGAIYDATLSGGFRMLFLSVAVSIGFSFILDEMLFPERSFWQKLFDFKQHH